MRVLAAATLAATLLPSGPAAAQPLPPEGSRCAVVERAEPGGGYTATFRAGPLVVADDDPGANPVRATVTCWVARYDHDKAPLASATSAPMDGVVVLPPTTVPVTGSWSDVHYLCTRVDIENGPTYYWDQMDAWWSTSPHGYCLRLDPDPCLDPYHPDCGGTAPLDRQLDHRLCPVLKAVAPPEGDVPGIWDCRPYNW
jgi:hypothetical protein